MCDECEVLTSKSFRERKARSWVFTLNNYTPEDCQRIEELSKNVKFIVVGKEIAPKTGTPHLQGYVTFTSPRTLRSVKRAIGESAHLEPARGSAADSIKYCSKESLWLTAGDPPLPGRRTDLETVRDEFVLHGSIRRVIMCDEALSYQAIKYVETLSKYVEPKRTWKTEVYWYWGPTGVGKTHRAYAEASVDGIEPYKNSGDLKWWDGYDAHEHVIIDDFRGTVRYDYMLNLLDNRDHRVEFKGGSRQFLAKKLWITSDRPPAACYQGVGDIRQLLRRINVIDHMEQRFSGTEVEGNTIPRPPSTDLVAYECDLLGGAHEALSEPHG